MSIGRAKRSTLPHSLKLEFQNNATVGFTMFAILNLRLIANRNKLDSETIRLRLHNFKINLAGSFCKLD